MRHRRYTIVIEKGPNSFGAFAPDLPGCVAVAKTRPAVRRLMREAVELHVESMQTRGLPLPPASAEAEHIEVAV